MKSNKKKIWSDVLKWEDHDPKVFMLIKCAYIEEHRWTNPTHFEITQIRRQTKKLKEK